MSWYQQGRQARRDGKGLDYTLKELPPEHFQMWQHGWLDEQMDEIFRL